ncbi:cilia- and flagella-associated protein 161 isoform X3 [Sphaerodactylus townsendi]|uniref:cilia- and flagella-associated protein 161 isoform X3 n=1 Tax=Sphaerodactylus townsendi TaxID=933632 RepID=UPI002026E758|nr:cilia- and flagella-associated protein 161 isoform X3 [Sphaerodactylus townsendi]
MFNFNLRTSRSGREYSPGVLIANWNEDVYLEEDLLKDFIYRRERGELLIQRSNKLKENLYKKEQLSISKDGFLHFGDTVLLVSPDEKSAMESSPCERGNLSLAVTPDEMSIHALDALPSPCGVSAIRLTDPIGRNAFQILSTEGASMGDPLRFGQNFGLGATGGFHDRMANNTKILITHCHTNQALAVPRTFWMRTYFGKEYEVVCNTYLDSHKAEEDKNYWIMVTGNPSDGSTTMFDRPPPPSEVTREKSSEVQTAT